MPDEGRAQTLGAGCNLHKAAPLQGREGEEGEGTRTQEPRCLPGPPRPPQQERKPFPPSSLALEIPPPAPEVTLLQTPRRPAGVRTEQVPATTPQTRAALWLLTTRQHLTWVVGGDTGWVGPGSSARHRPNPPEMQGERPTCTWVCSDQRPIRAGTPP